MKEIDWANLSFGYMKTDYNAVSYTHLSGIFRQTEHRVRNV